jgi:hypothetical protein
MNATHKGTSWDTGRPVIDARRNIDQLWKIVNNLAQEISELKRQNGIYLSNMFGNKPTAPVLPCPQLSNIAQSIISHGVGIMAIKEGIADPLPVALRTLMYIDVNGQLCLMDSTGYKVTITRGDGWHVDGSGPVGTPCDLFSFKEQTDEPWSINGFSQLYSAEDEYFSMEDSKGTRFKIATSTVPQVTGVSQSGVRPGFALKENSADPKMMPGYSQLYVDTFSFLCIMDSTGYKYQIGVSL